MTFGEKLTRLRKREGLSQEALAERLGVSRQAVSRWESGQTSPDAATLAALCEKLRVSADYVLLGKEPGEGQSTGPAYEPPDTCPCCGRPVEGSICPSCGFTLPTTPPRGPRYAIISESIYFQNEKAAQQLEHFCGIPLEQAKAILKAASVTGVLLRRDLTDSAAQYLAAHLSRDLFSPLRIVEDAGEAEDALLAKPSAMTLPPPAEGNSGIGFFGVVLAVIVALLILSFF